MPLLLRQTQLVRKTHERIVSDGPKTFHVDSSCGFLRQKTGSERPWRSKRIVRFDVMNKQIEWRDVVCMCSQPVQHLAVRLGSSFIGVSREFFQLMHGAGKYAFSIDPFPNLFKP